MKFLKCLLICLLFQIEYSYSQNQYAVIIGISNYQSPGIDKLDYAHKDAGYFADYLKSKSGGAVPEDNIVLLQNEKATYSAIYNALDWLIETCKEGDLVYFYFSGHGDMENSTIYKLGFLISYNTPRTNYINNAVRIEDLNNYANTLSVKTKAKVILITDACHSGTLAGNENRGTYLVGEQLKTVLNNEIRITSCAPDQLSVEDKKWGGGRGVFSYYLLNGLTGLADEKKDGKVSVKEIANYLQTSMSSDPVLKARNQQQTPVIKGKEDFLLASVDKISLEGLQNNIGKNMIVDANAVGLAPLPKSPSSYFFNMLESEKIERLFNFIYLSTLTAAEIPIAMINDDAVQTEKKEQLPALLKSNPDALKRFNKKLVEIISNRGQDIINLYLSGDEAEIERRRYYNSIKNDYDEYAKMFEVALKLSDANSLLARILEIKQHYFAGVALRIKIPLSKNPDSLINAALAEQMKALQIEQNAAYIHNELGLLYKMKKDYAKSEIAFQKAMDIAPAWAIPYSNMANLYLLTNKIDKGLKAVDKADSLQKDYQGTYVNKGRLYEQKNNWLQAEEQFRKSIELNSRHFLPFERLGFIYTNTTQYVLADSFFHESEIRKLGYNLELPDSDGDGIADRFDEKPNEILCTIPQKINENDIMTCLIEGLLYLQNNKEKEAEVSFRKVITIDKSNPLAFHYLGKLMWKQKRWEETDIYLNMAVKYYLNECDFEKYCDSVKKLITNKDECIYMAFKASYYYILEDYFLLGDAYEQWHHYSEAEMMYEKAIKIDSLYAGGYYKLWNLLEFIGRYYDAEAVLNRYKRYFEDGTNQLYSFYKRVTEKFPSSGEWQYKAGNFYYYEVMLYAEKYMYERFENNPDQGIGPFKIDALFKTEEDSMSHYGRKIYGTSELIKEGEVVDIPKRKGIIYLLKADSLINDDIQLADINSKIGDLYVALNSTVHAFAYYQKSSALQGNNAGTRLKLIDAWDANFHFQEAKKQLDTILLRNEINYAKLLLLAKYKMHSGEFNGTDTLLSRAKKIHPYKMPEVEDLNGRLQLMSKKYKSAIPYYTEYLQLLPNDASTMYTMAKIYCKEGNQKESYEWLKKSVKAGFNCYWVLKYDPVWEKERSTSQWKELTAGIQPKPF